MVCHLWVLLKGIRLLLCAQNPSRQTDTEDCITGEEKEVLQGQRGSAGAPFHGTSKPSVLTDRSRSHPLPALTALCTRALTQPEEHQAARAPGLLHTARGQALEPALLPPSSQPEARDPPLPSEVALQHWETLTAGTPWRRCLSHAQVAIRRLTGPTHFPGIWVPPGPLNHCEANL